MSTRSARLVRRVAATLALLLFLTVGSAQGLVVAAVAAPASLAPAATAPAVASPRLGPPVQQAAAVAAAQDFSLVTTASTTSLPYEGGAVTFSYTLTNTGQDRLYFQSGIDTGCPTVAYVSGGSTSGIDNTRVFDAGQTLVFRCTTNVTVTTTNTAIFVFGYGNFCNTQCDATVTRTSSTTVTVQQPQFACNTMWYGSVAAGTSVGSLGYLRPASTQTVAINPPGLDDTYNNTAAIAIDPTNPNYVYYAPRTAAGVYSNSVFRYDIVGGTQTLVASGTTAGLQFATNRLGFDNAGLLWSFTNTGQLYSWTAAGFSAAKAPVASNGVDLTGLASGDIAFDGAGTIWILAATGTTSYLYTISAAQLATAALAATLVGIMTSPGATTFYNGIAFDATGTLYATANLGTNLRGLYSVNKDTGATTQSSNGTSRGTVADLASCALPKPALRVQKTVSPATVVKGGETLTYTVKTDNIGSLSATGVTFQDSIPANTTYVRGSTTLNGAAVADTAVAPFFPYAGTVPVNGAGVNAGVIPAGGAATVTFKVLVSTLTSSVRSVCNQGTVNYTGGSAVLSDDPNVAGAGDPTCNLAYTPGIRVIKTADPTTVNISGPVTYSYSVLNVGNEPLRAVTVADDKGTVSQTHTGDTNGDGLLQFGETWVYSLTQTLGTTTTNTATAVGTGNVSGASAVHDLDGNGADAGDTVEYSFAVRNDGSSTLSAVRFSDPLLGLTDEPCIRGGLAPGQTALCTRTFDYPLTQDDIDGGSVVNTATATANTADRSCTDGVVDDVHPDLHGGSDPSGQERRCRRGRQRQRPPGRRGHRRLRVPGHQPVQRHPAADGRQRPARRHGHLHVHDDPGAGEREMHRARAHPDPGGRGCRARRQRRRRHRAGPGEHRRLRP